VEELFKKKFFWLFAVFSLSLSIRLYDLHATGGLWDEDIYFQSGYNFIYNIRNLDFHPDKWGWNSEHPPVAKYLYGLGAYASFHLPDNPAYRAGLNYGAPRVISAILGALTVGVVFLIGWTFFSRSVGIYAAIILGLLPQFIAYNKALDLGTPLVFFAALAFLFLLKGTGGGYRDILLSSIFVGLAGSSRYDGFVLVPIFAFVYVLSLVKHDRAFLRRNYKNLVVRLLTQGVVPPLVLCASWPYLWLDPLRKIQESLSFQAQHLAGDNILQVVTLFIFTQPALILSLFMAGSYFMISGLKKRKVPETSLIVFFVLYFLALILLGVRGTRFRYILLSQIPLSLIAAYGLRELIPYRRKSIAAASLVVLTIYLLFSNARIHPYYLDYFSEFIGGAEGASRFGLPTGTRGEGIKEAIDFVNEHVAEGSYVKFIGLLDEVPPLRSDLVRLPDYDDSTGEDGKIYTNFGGEAVLADYWVFNPYYFAQDYKVSDNPNYRLYYQSKVSGKVPLVSVYELVGE